MAEQGAPAEANGEALGFGGALRELFLNTYTMALLAVLVLRALLIPLTGFRASPLRYWRYPDMLPRVAYFFDPLLFGFAHSVYYAFMLPRFFLWLNLGILGVPSAVAAPLGVVGFVAAGFTPYVIGFPAARRWKPLMRVAIPLATGLLVLMTHVHLLLFLVWVLLPYTIASLLCWRWRNCAARVVPVGVGLVALVAFNLYCGYHVLIAMVPSM